jgi:molecular chaperone DnaJ
MVAPSAGSGTITNVAAVKRDYYEVLGVPRDADEEEIRGAFHALARDWHPDLADAPDAEERFRELAEAYSVLSRREARALYDRYAYRGRGNQGVDEGHPGARGEDVHAEVELESFEADMGTRRLVGFQVGVRCTACMGHGHLGLPDPECEHCLGTGRKRTLSNVESAQTLEFQTCPACIGEPCARCGGKGTVNEERRLRLRIPAGVEDGSQLRVAGEGNDAGSGSVPGDLLVRVHVLPAPRDPRLVRYLAFALLIVAIATLVLYVVH